MNLSLFFLLWVSLQQENRPHLSHSLSMALVEEDLVTQRKFAIHVYVEKKHLSLSAETWDGREYITYFSA